jgi:hypothetical protein
MSGFLSGKSNSDTLDNAGVKSGPGEEIIQPDLPGGFSL